MMPAPDPLGTPVRLTARELRDQELVHAFAATGCSIVEWVRHSEADYKTRVRALERIADVAAFHLHRLKLDGQ